MAFLSIQGLSKTYKEGVKALDNINLDVEKGEFSVIIGPSGCGKSTLLKIIAGLETPDFGDIFLDGISQNSIPPHKRNIAMMFQNYVLFPHMDVFQNLTFGMKVRKTPKAVINEEVERVCGILGIADILKRRPHEISGGQRQRVAMGRAILKKPSLYLMDEPLSNLDAKMRTQMRFELKEIQRQLGAAFIYVTHDQTEAMTLGDTVSVFNNGVCQQCSSPLNIYQNPKNLFVADFMANPQLNKINVIDNKSGNPSYVWEDETLPGFDIPGNRDFRHDSIILAFRPEHLFFGSQSQKPHLKITALIKYIEQMGSHSFLHLEAKGTHLVAKTEAPGLFNINQIVSFHVNTENCMGFYADGHSDMRIF